MFLYVWMIIQVVAESLPISSSGHVALMHEMQHQMIADVWAFDYLLQGVSAVVFLSYFFNAWWKLVVKNPIGISALFSANVWRKNIIPVLIFGIAADGMTFLLWCLQIDQLCNFPLIIGFVITTCALWSTQYAVEKKDVDIWSIKNGLVVGFVQGCALLPGISRFGTTFATLRWLGYQNRDAFSISFLIQWPLIVAGSLVGFKALHDLGRIHDVITLQFICLTLVAAMCAYELLCVVKKIIDKNLFWKFSYYMIIPITIALFV